ncbi:protein-(glutamine-N5) methyltransferase, release factor-specific [Serinicoccus sp. CNJ-927]|uniref:peptide chain release factor N(5)-glutamine methyltransferase n=1 Tax=Serinicoccus sp. CNJ-927 TaxID=1904970 RepID=UPI0009622EEF|nr:peptide chain release factor N(5)-glutamine methyltransferase [Serinicoccus sp. CNJ-927]OLT43450.1 protein-(glutamine-N5) methyltransferase, release factor-specific [Serinicoccus sp. CNJ-927]
MTVDELVRAATRWLAGAGVPSPGVDAELLLAHALGQDVSQVRRGRVLRESVGAQAHARFLELVVRRAEREPLQHLTGTAHFHGLDLSVGPGVFVPRPETETLVDLALRHLAPLREPVVVDLCTGSGAVALAIAVARPDARMGAVELSPEAYRYARANVAALGADVDLRLGEAQEAFADLLGRVDVVVSNPPYIPPDAVPVDVEVREHDPGLALYGGGADGLEVPAQVAARAWDLLRPSGALLMEHADVQGDAVVELLTGAGWGSVLDHEDLTGRPRVVGATRPAR